MPNNIQPLAKVVNPSPAATPITVEKIDPFERWNQLATLGQQTTSLSNNNWTQDSQTFEQAQSLPNQSETSESKNTPDNSENDASPIQIANASNSEQDKASAISTVPSNKLNGNQSKIPTPGELGILNRTPPNFKQETITASNSPIQVQIGTSAELYNFNYFNFFTYFWFISVLANFYYLGINKFGSSVLSMPN